MARKWISTFSSSHTHFEQVFHIFISSVLEPYNHASSCIVTVNVTWKWAKGPDRSRWYFSIPHYKYLHKCLSSCLFGLVCPRLLSFLSSRTLGKYRMSSQNALMMPSLCSQHWIYMNNSKGLHKYLSSYFWYSRFVLHSFFFYTIFSIFDRQSRKIICSACVYTEPASFKAVIS